MHVSEMILEGVLDMYTLEYIGEPCGHPRSVHTKYPHQTKKIKIIRRILAERISSRLTGLGDTKLLRRIVNECRAEINQEYGPFWRKVFNNPKK